MLESGQSWELFGYDTRNLGRYVVSAFRDFFWAYDSPVRERLDEVVSLNDGEQQHCYHAGHPCAAAPTACRAVLLPDELALARQLKLPLAVEAELEGAIEIEANASSPFAADDTGIGWRVVRRDEQFVYVDLVIVSLSAAMAYIGQRYASHDAHAQEVWVASGGQMVVIQGFGEDQREKLYRRRLLRVAYLIGAAALVVLLILLTGAGIKKWELGRLSAIEESTREAAAEPMRLRSMLGEANDTIAAANAIAAQFPNPHVELARITHLLDDGAYVDRLVVEGREIDIRGKAVNAARVMELLTEQDAYSGVTAGSPIRKLPNTDREQFHLKVERAEQGE